MKDTDLIIAVLLTLSYSDQFAYPLNFNEIKERLIFRHPRATKKAHALKARYSLSQLYLALNELKKLKLITLKQNYYFLITSPQALAIRKKHNLLSQEKWREVARAVALLKTIPWINAIYITGSLAVDNVVPHDDIDFMIVVRHHRLWLTRLWVIIITAMVHKLRIRKGRDRDTWCFNMWLSSNDLRIACDQQNLYSAYELLQAKCVWEKEKVDQQFRAQNNWVGNYLVDFDCDRSDDQSLAVEKKNYLLVWLSFACQPFLDVSNFVAYFFQWLYMKPHMTNEQVSLNRAFFHPRQTRLWINNRWKDSLLKLLNYDQQ